MKYSIVFVAAAATYVSAFALPAAQISSSCDITSLTDCVTPLAAQVEACSTDDVDCICGSVSDLVACYDQFCPGQQPAEAAEAIDACNAAGSDISSLAGGFEEPTLSSVRVTATSAVDDEEATSTDFEATTTDTLIDAESTATSTKAVTKTTSAIDEEDDSTSTASKSETTGGAGAATTTRRPAAQSSGAADSLNVPALGGLMAAALGVVAWL